MTEELATLRVSAVRRVIGLGVLLALAGLLLQIALVHPPAGIGYRAFLLAMGAGALALAEAMRRATARRLVLTREGLFDDRGRELARIERISGLDRGMLAFKPSNGFSLSLTEALPRAWAPGVWWRFGRRVGVGGVTSAGEAKAMAEILTALLQEKAGRG
ncbi:hypothetical protein DSD19_19835 [Rhodovulum sp. BSW8]|uniref:PH (Pleckstrin Homology) domain-containing protein n=1 Tax=Rhodovulum visakhapatnamense TaxID=364297 RepID=A0A4R8FXB8_9RHOB|nr:MULTISPECIES: hypothetical protein [Rhodovulum]OLS44033.1 hypothetical protein BV509_06525 [Rhodovulum sulfidophilum]MBL3569240.1 hypothetical protein [Rhodovulum visakhapatnamense]MBL3577466.1 hypothetical protein [Rhodovulum visakhapatnamense]RBO51369.1 hypothetical protein DSD19_19835 [Rhodovulum sp. BSW8]TDX31276.1 hypothetical protein EV657_105123 [Rhodovulum visakhapatnamense]